jgi:hypothetical protein
MVLDTDFNLGDEVYLTTDNEQLKRLITCIQISPIGLLYKATCGTDETWHYSLELSIEKTLHYD